MTTSRRHFSSTLAQYSQCRDWFKEITGYRTSRLDQYLKDLERILERIDNTDTFVYRISELHEISSTLVEIEELIRIWRGFREKVTAGLLARAKHIVGGPVRAIEEHPASTRARNFSLELDFAGLCSLSGIPVDIDCESDCVIEVNGVKVHVEAKRVYTKSKIETRIKEAIGQIEASLAKVTEIRVGLILFDASLAFLEGNNFYSLEDPEYSSVITSAFNRMFDEEYVGKLAAQHGDRIIGIMNRIAYVTGGPNSSGFGYEITYPLIIFGGTTFHMAKEIRETILRSYPKKIGT